MQCNVPQTMDLLCPLPTSCTLCICTERVHFRPLLGSEKAGLRQPILILFPFGNAVLLRKWGQSSNPRFVAWPLELGLGTHNPRFVAWPPELGLGTLNPRVAA